MTKFRLCANSYLFNIIPLLANRCIKNSYTLFFVCKDYASSSYKGMFTLVDQFQYQIPSSVFYPV